MTDRLSMLNALKRASIREIDVAGIKLFIRGLTGAERLELVSRQKASKDGGPPLTDAELCSWGICTSDGERLCKDGDAELAGVDGKALETIALAILDASGLTPEKKDAASGESPASPS